MRWPAAVARDVLAGRWRWRARAGSGAAGGEPPVRPHVHVYGTPDDDWTLVLGDVDGLPTITSVVDRLDGSRPTVVFVAIDRDGERGALRTAPGLRVSWVVGRRAGRRGHPLDDALAAAALPAGAPTVVVVGASLVDRGIGRHLRGAHGLAVGPLRTVVYRAQDPAAGIPAGARAQREAASRPAPVHASHRSA